MRAVADPLISRITDTTTPQGVVAVVATADVDLERALTNQPRLVVVLAGIADPGNAGTVIRTADAMGADLVAVTTGSVDVYSGKCVRASAGSLFHVPVAAAAAPEPLLDRMSAIGLRVLAASATGDTDLDRMIDAGELAEIGRASCRERV